jgi:hypothetical protein
MQRRRFIHQAAATSFVATAANSLWASDRIRAPRILLRSSWQVVNIGDIAHTPGVLALLEQHLPEAEVILWASDNLTDEVAAMEHRRFPKLKIVKGSILDDGSASNEELAAAIQWTDFLLHGSGPSLVAAKDVAAFVKHTGKPFGVYGITHGGFFADDTTEILSQAKFIFFRDSVSLEYAKQQGVNQRRLFLLKMNSKTASSFAAYLDCDIRRTGRSQATSGKKTRRSINTTSR